MGLPAVKAAVALIMLMSLASLASGVGFARAELKKRDESRRTRRCLRGETIMMALRWKIAGSDVGCKVGCLMVLSLNNLQIAVLREEACL